MRAKCIASAISPTRVVRRAGSATSAAAIPRLRISRLANVDATAHVVGRQWGARRLRIRRLEAGAVRVRYANAARHADHIRRTHTAGTAVQHRAAIRRSGARGRGRARHRARLVACRIGNADGTGVAAVAATRNRALPSRVPAIHHARAAVLSIVTGVCNWRRAVGTGVSRRAGRRCRTRDQR